MMSYPDFLKKMDKPLKFKRYKSVRNGSLRLNGKELEELDYELADLKAALVACKMPNSITRVQKFPFPRFLYDDLYDSLKVKYEIEIFPEINLMVWKYCEKNITSEDFEKCQTRLQSQLKTLLGTCSRFLGEYKEDSSFKECIEDIQNFIQAFNHEQQKEMKKKGKKGHPELSLLIKDISTLLSKRSRTKRNTNQIDACSIIRKINDNFNKCCFSLNRSYPMFPNIDGQSFHDENLIKRINNK